MCCRLKWILTVAISALLSSILIDGAADVSSCAGGYLHSEILADVNTDVIRTDLEDYMQVITYQTYDE